MASMSEPLRAGTTLLELLCGLTLLGLLLGMATVHGGVKTLLDLNRVFLTEGLLHVVPPETPQTKEPQTV